METDVETQLAFHLKSPTRKDSVLRGINISEILTLLEDEHECHCTVNARLIGVSGANHTFDVVAKKGFDSISLSFIQERVSLLDSQVAAQESEENLMIEAIRLGAKAMDCGSNLSFIVHLSSYLPSTSITPGEDGSQEREKGLLDVLGRFNIKLIEAPDVPTATRKMREVLNTVDFNYAY
jgi:hypothetical protein